jgi:hypothetical protein
MEKVDYDQLSLDWQEEMVNTIVNEEKKNSPIVKKHLIAQNGTTSKLRFNGVSEHV